MAIQDLEASLGVTFQNQGLLRQALVHRSYLNEHGGSTHDSYERMEFLGDAVLELIISTELYQHLPHVTEGQLTKGRSALVCRPSLAGAARRLGLGQHLALGKGEVESGGHDRESILEEAFEAVLAAVYLDQGYSAARSLALRSLEPDLDAIVRRGGPLDNPKSRLQELVQGSGGATPRYHLVSAAGPDHSPVFTVQVLVGDEVWGQGTGSRKSDAERAAAQLALAQWEAVALETGSPVGRVAATALAATKSTETLIATTRTVGDVGPENPCSHSFEQTGNPPTGQKPKKASNAAGNAGLGASSKSFAPLTWMIQFGKSWRKSSSPPT